MALRPGLISQRLLSEQDQAVEPLPHGGFMSMLPAEPIDPEAAANDFAVGQVLEPTPPVPGPSGVPAESPAFPPPSDLVRGAHTRQLEAQEAARAQAGQMMTTLSAQIERAMSISAGEPSTLEKIFNGRAKQQYRAMTHQMQQSALRELVPQYRELAKVSADLAGPTDYESALTTEYAQALTKEAENRMELVRRHQAVADIRAAGIQLDPVQEARFLNGVGEDLTDLYDTKGLKEAAEVGEMLADEDAAAKVYSRPGQEYKRLAAMASARDAAAEVARESGPGGQNYWFIPGEFKTRREALQALETRVDELKEDDNFNPKSYDLVPHESFDPLTGTSRRTEAVRDKRDSRTNDEIVREAIRQLGMEKYSHLLYPGTRPMLGPENKTEGVSPEDLQLQRIMNGLEQRSKGGGSEGGEE